MTTYINPIRILILLVFVVFESCNGQYDPELMQPDGHHSGYNLTPLGRLVNGPWAVDCVNHKSGMHGTRLFINDKKILSDIVPYTELQKDLVFELHKEGKLTYWFKSENGIIDVANDSDKIKVTVLQSHQDDNLKKVYDTGYWKANFKDSTVLINFQNPAIPTLNYKYTYLANGGVTFQETYSFDTLYNGKKL